MNCDGFDQRMNELLDEHRMVDDDPVIQTHLLECDDCYRKLVIWQRVEGQMVIMALFNWTEEETEIVVTPRQGALLPEEGEIFEIWKDESFKPDGEVLRRRLPPHSCELFEWDLV